MESIIEHQKHQQLSPAHLVLLKAEYTNYVLSNENQGFLSRKYGLLPKTPPLKQFAKTHKTWDEVVQMLPELFQSSKIRKHFHEMPLLSADKNDLPNQYLLRAATVLGLCAHAYFWLEPTKPKKLPDALTIPWQKVCQRLGRKSTFFSYSDLILYNWQLKNSQNINDRYFDNINLLVETIGMQAEQYYYGYQVEMTHIASPIVSAIVDAQDAVLTEDVNKLKNILANAAQIINKVTMSLRKISSNPYCDQTTDILVWSRSIAPLTLSIRKDNQEGPNWSATPLLHIIDAFISRTSYQSVYGQEQLYYQNEHNSLHIKNFIQAITKISVRDYIIKTNDNELINLFNQFVESYTGKNGLLNIHRHKMYAFIRPAFKIGNFITTDNTKASNPLISKEWQIIDMGFKKAIEERYHSVIPISNQFKITSKTLYKNTVKEISIKVGNKGITYNVGDHIALFPTNVESTIQEICALFEIDSNYPIALNATWRDYIQLKANTSVPIYTITLKEFLRFAKLSPLQRETLQKIYKITKIKHFQEILANYKEDTYDFSNILETLKSSGFDLKRFCEAKPWDKENLSQLLQPETQRLYAIASYHHINQSFDSINLLVAPLQYKTSDFNYETKGKKGVFSKMISQSDTDPEKYIDMNVVPHYFNFASISKETPIIMIASDTGVSPFKGLLQYRNHHNAKDNWLLYTAHQPENFYYQDTFAASVGNQSLKLDVAFSKQGAKPQLIKKDDRFSFQFKKDDPKTMTQLMQKETVTKDLLDWFIKKKACILICGAPKFVSNIYSILLSILENHFNSKQKAFVYLAKAAANTRFLIEVHTPFSPKTQLLKGEYQYLYLSEIAKHNNKKDGYWCIVQDEIYDLTDFMHFHPGGMVTIQSVAGTDATDIFETIEHHQNPSIQATLSMYKLGGIRIPNFKNQWSITVSEKKFTVLTYEMLYQLACQYLILLTEIKNMLQLDLTHYHQNKDLYPNLSKKYEHSALTIKNFLDISLPVILGSQLITLWKDIIFVTRSSLNMEKFPKDISRLFSNIQKNGLFKIPEVLLSVSAQIASNKTQDINTKVQKIPSTYITQLLNWLTSFRKEVIQFVAILEQENINFIHNEEVILIFDNLSNYINQIEHTLMQQYNELLFIPI